MSIKFYLFQHTTDFIKSCESMAMMSVIPALWKVEIGNREDHGLKLVCAKYW
jgi:hypothetical protein